MCFAQIFRGQWSIALRHCGFDHAIVNQAGGFLRGNPSRPRPNLQTYFAPITYTTAPEGERPLMRPDPYPGFLHSIGQCRPQSRGQLQIVSPDPQAPVSIRPNYFSADEDIAQMLEGVRLLRQFAATPALAEIIDSEDLGVVPRGEGGAWAEGAAPGWAARSRSIRAAGC